MMKTIDNPTLIEDEIVSIEEYGIIDTIDIEVESDSRLFFANDILTHNCGINNTDLKLTDVSESAALLHTVDMLFGIITDPEMKARKEYYVKCLASRVSSYENTKKRYTIDWTYARIEEDKNTPIQDLDFVINSANPSNQTFRRTAPPQANVAFTTSSPPEKKQPRAKEITIESLDAVDFGNIAGFQ